VLPGPEYGLLQQPGMFFLTQWRTTYKMDKMGIRLAGEVDLANGLGNMISGAVADGTIQLTKEGPIILLRHRQTTGGYPRIFNVISADVDLLGQYAPNQAIHFVQVTLEQAREFARLKEADLDKLRAPQL
jgi:allophanate hydrolase subunit 2